MAYVESGLGTRRPSRMPVAPVPYGAFEIGLFIPNGRASSSHGCASRHVRRSPCDRRRSLRMKASPSSSGDRAAELQYSCARAMASHAQCSGNSSHDGSSANSREPSKCGLGGRFATAIWVLSGAVVTNIVRIVALVRTGIERVYGDHVVLLVMGLPPVDKSGGKCSPTRLKTRYTFFTLIPKII